MLITQVFRSESFAKPAWNRFRTEQPRQSGTSHLIYKTPWPGDPRVNIQNAGGQAKAYQVRQVLEAIDKLETGNEC